MRRWRQGDGAVFADSAISHKGQVSPDGSHAIFMSKASLTGFDNVEAITGEAVDEVFLYDAGEGELNCISCNPTGARPVGRELHNGQSEVWGVAQIPRSQSQLYAKPRLISDDGSRAYFESVEALVLADTNGAQDVYQWEEPGAGDCSEASPAFNALNGGCLSLISSGESPVDSEIIDVSPTGDDVFFATEAALLPQDKGLIDVYDARVGGGYPQPEGVAECEGEACQGPYDPPEDPTPASSSYEGPGNPSAAKATKPRCAKGKRAVRRGGKTRCVAKQQAGKGKTAPQQTTGQSQPGAEGGTMRRFTAILAAGCLGLLALGSTTASADFGLKPTPDITFTDLFGGPAMQAGTHPPQMTTTFDFNTTIHPSLGEIPDEAAKDVMIELPPGQVGDPAAMPPCPSIVFLQVRRRRHPLLR